MKVRTVLSKTFLFIEIPFAKIIFFHSFSMPVNLIKNLTKALESILTDNLLISFLFTLIHKFTIIDLKNISQITVKM